MITPCRSDNVTATQNAINMKIIYAILQSFSNSIIRFVRNEYKRYKGRPKALLKAIEKAKKLNLKTGKRYKVFFLQNRYQCLTRMDLKNNKRIGIFNEHINATRMTPLSFFDTESGYVSPFALDLLLTKYSSFKLLKLGIVHLQNT